MRSSATRLEGTCVTLAFDPHAFPRPPRVCLPHPDPDLTAHLSSHSRAPPTRRSTFDETHVHLDELNSLQRKSTTNYKTKMGKTFLSVEQVWFLAKSTHENPKQAHPAYLKDAIAAKFAPVSMVDRKDLLLFLTGKTDTSAQIDLTHVPAFMDAEEALDEQANSLDVAGRVGGSKRGRDLVGSEIDEKKPKQRPLHTRDSALQCDKSFSAVLGFFGAQLPSELGSKKKESVKKPSGIEPPPLVNIEPIRTNRFDRGKDKDDFYAEHMGRDFVDFGIVDDGGFLPGGGNGKVLPELSEQERAKAEQVTGHKITDGSRPNGAVKANARSSQKPSSSQKRDPAAGKMPVILVPPGYGSKVMFNMYNAGRFLEGEKLVPWDELHKKDAKKKVRMVIKRRYKVRIARFPNPDTLFTAPA